jgi:hypothetical protein
MSFAVVAPHREKREGCLLSMEEGGVSIATVAARKSSIWPGSMFYVRFAANFWVRGTEREK